MTSHAFLIAKHLNGIKVYLEAATTSTSPETAVITLEVPESILYMDSFNCLENGTNIAISECKLFSCYVGIGSSVHQARTKLTEVLTRVLSELVSHNALIQYLIDIHFDVIQLTPALNTGPDNILIIRAV